jgi:mono/diheme cytochrome c family protein
MHFRPAAAALSAALLSVSVGVFIASASADQSTADDPYAGGDAQRGQQVFANNGCGWCHEGSGTAAGRGPPLAGTKRSNEFLATRILNGLQGRMPAFGGNFDEDQVKDLIAFIHSIKPETAQ